MITFEGKDRLFSLDERERYIQEIEGRLKGQFVYLKTCNRVELYQGDGECDEWIVRHLFRVCSGLESAIRGEMHIQGQVKRAYMESLSGKRSSSGLNRLFQAAIKIGKKVRRESGISSGHLCYSNIVSRMIQREFPAFEDASITVLGVNLLSENIIRKLSGLGASQIRLLNRTWEKALDLAHQYGLSAFSLNEFEKYLHFTDILITVTSSGIPLIREESFPKNRSMLILDLSVPRNVEPGIGRRSGVRLYNIENVEQSISLGKNFDQDAFIHAERMLKQEVIRFINNQRKYRRMRGRPEKEFLEASPLEGSESFQ